RRQGRNAAINRNATRHWKAFQEALSSRRFLAAHRNERDIGKPAPQHGIGLGRLRILVNQKKDHGLDRSLARFFEEPDFVDDKKKILERAMAEIDDLCRIVIGDQPIEKRHLTRDVAYV